MKYIRKITTQGSQVKQGTSVERGIPVAGFDDTLSVQVVTPTRFAVNE